MNLIILLPSPPFLTASQPMSNAVWNFWIKTEKDHLSWPVLSAWQLHSSFVFILFLKLKKFLLLAIILHSCIFWVPKILFLAFFSCPFSTVSACFCQTFLILYFPNDNCKGCTYREINLNRNLFHLFLSNSILSIYVNKNCYNFSETVIAWFAKVFFFSWTKEAVISLLKNNISHSDFYF